MADYKDAYVGTGFEYGSTSTTHEVEVDNRLGFAEEFFKVSGDIEQAEHSIKDQSDRLRKLRERQEKVHDKLMTAIRAAMPSDNHAADAGDDW